MKKYLEKLFESLSNKLSYLNEIEVQFSIPAVSEHGDYSTNAAMLLAKSLKKNPRAIASEIIDNLELDKNIIAKVELAGAGFINFFFHPDYTTKVISEILQKDDHFGKSNKFEGKRANVEFVSANPTGPLTVGHGRNAVIGDTLANLLESIGYDVDREYYFNNAGRQMRVLGESLKLRYLELFGDKIDFPADYYQGDYLIDIARKIKEEFGEKYRNEDPLNYFKQRAEYEIFEDIKNTLSRLKIEMKNFFNEHSLYENGNIQDVLNAFKDKNLSYDKDGAVWLKLSELGNENDKVIVKSTGEPTYRLPDIAYHMNKLERGYDLVVDLFGSDHNATYPDVIAGVNALGYDGSKIKVVIHQFVTITDGGEKVKMSTRKANFITLDELIDEVGPDVVRYFFIMRNVSSHLNFDIALAKKHNEENPVFYLQYAHARICSILRMTEEQNLAASQENLSLLSSEVEQSLIKKLHQFEDVILYSAESFEPNKLTSYLEETAALFHKFYTECRILGTEKNLAEARIALCESVKILLKNGLSILGLNAPEKM
ncbi:MAG: arginine--tRNA ligase [Melioribacteraceae bacterium]|nr:arginine--tRNA ligase [Melioribacteraceae bacterium]